MKTNIDVVPYYILERVKSAWRDTPIKWSPIPVGLGLAFIAFLQYQKILRREAEKDNDKSTQALIVGPWHVSDNSLRCQLASDNQSLRSILSASN